MKQLFLTAVFVSISLITLSQVKGVVLGNDTLQKKAIKGASLLLLESQIKTASNEEGGFEFILPKSSITLLVKL